MRHFERFALIDVCWLGSVSSDDCYGNSPHCDHMSAQYRQYLGQASL